MDEQREGARAAAAVAPVQAEVVVTRREVHGAVGGTHPDRGVGAEGQLGERVGGRQPLRAGRAERAVTEPGDGRVGGGIVERVGDTVAVDELHRRGPGGRAQPGGPLCCPG